MKVYERKKTKKEKRELCLKECDTGKELMEKNKKREKRI